MVARVVGILVLGLLLYGVWKIFIRPLVSRNLRMPDTIMPYCSKCESNRHVVANAGNSGDGFRWHCAHCNEGF